MSPKSKTNRSTFPLMIFRQQCTLHSNGCVCLLDILFRQITKFIKVCMAFVFGFQTLWLIDYTKSYQFKGLKPKNKGHMNFYECCDLMKKVYLVSLCSLRGLPLHVIISLWVFLLMTKRLMIWDKTVIFSQLWEMILSC